MLSHPTRDIRKPLIVLTTILLMVGLSFLFYQPTKRAIAPEIPTQPVIVPPAGAIVIRGTMVCLPHKDLSGPQTLECAFGLNDGAGRFFALRDTDPTYKNISDAPMSTPVEVIGTFTPDEDTKYQSVGTIDVAEIRRLVQLQPSQSETN